MAPESYQPPMRGDDATQQSQSQSAETALRHAGDKATIADILSGKGDAVASVAPDDTIATAAARLRDRGIGAVLVIDGDGHMTGILSERDIVRQLADSPGRTLPMKVSELMTAEIEFCARHDHLDAILKRMTEGRFRHMPVVEEGVLLGIISIGDVVKHRLTELEYEALKMKQMIVG